MGLAAEWISRICVWFASVFVLPLVAVGMVYVYVEGAPELIYFFNKHFGFLVTSFKGVIRNAADFFGQFAIRKHFDTSIPYVILLASGLFMYKGRTAVALSASLVGAYIEYRRGAAKSQKRAILAAVKFVAVGVIALVLGVAEDYVMVFWMLISEFILMYVTRAYFKNNVKKAGSSQELSTDVVHALKVMCNMQWIVDHSSLVLRTAFWLLCAVCSCLLWSIEVAFIVLNAAAVFEAVNEEFVFTVNSPYS
jgi:hypothetical protein